MTRERKRLLSMCAVITLIAVMIGMYMWQQRAESLQVIEEDEINMPTLGTTLISRPQSDVVSVTFHSGGEPYTMVPRVLEDIVLSWRWGPATDFLLNSARAQDKVRLAWQLTASGIAHECTADLDLAEFGLYPPLFKMEVEYRDRTMGTIRIGLPTPDRRHHFMMVDDDPTMYLLVDFMVARVTQTIEQLIDTTLPRMDIEEMQFFKIDQRDRPTIVLEVAYGEGLINEEQALLSALAMPQYEFLRMFEPIPGRGINTERLEMFVVQPLNALRLLEVVSLAPTDLAPYGLTNPSLEFVYRGQTAASAMHLLFGDVFVHDGALYIYVKFADRPHVFKALQAPASVLFDLGIFTFAERFLALVGIVDVERIEITSPNPVRNFDMVVNHFIEGDRNEIAPVINGAAVPAAPFRTMYGMLIGLAADGAVEPFAPQGTPEFTIVYSRIENPDIELRFFAYDSNFYVVSINGADVWGLTSRLNVQTFFNQINIVIGG